MMQPRSPQSLWCCHKESLCRLGLSLEGPILHQWVELAGGSTTFLGSRYFIPIRRVASLRGG